MSNASLSSAHPHTEMSHVPHSSAHPDTEMSHASRSSAHPDTEMSNVCQSSVHNVTTRQNADENDGWTEGDGNTDVMSGNMDTVMQPADYREFNQILSVAPGEGNTPLGMFQDKQSEFLSFPNIYCGQTRCDNNSRETRLHYSTICKWELRNVDRRVANDVTNIFFKLKKLQIKQISDKVSLALRKCKLKNKQLTAGDILSSDSVNKILKHDEGYRVLRSLRGSPPYWEKAKKDIFSMIKQLGIPTWFCSFSAAETRWLPLLRTLAKSKYNKTLSDQELSALTWIEKNELIKSDPINCARYFDFRFQSFFHEVLHCSLKPIGNIIDFFYRIEFQQRGSPHVHMLVWVEEGGPVSVFGPLKNPAIRPIIMNHALQSLLTSMLHARRMTVFLN